MDLKWFLVVTWFHIEPFFENYSLLQYIEPLFLRVDCLEFHGHFQLNN